MSNTLKIRPEARLIKSIGEDLIKDYYAAVIELVKNAYDADSEQVNITLSLENENIYNEPQEFLKFTIEDTGEGMSFETIKNAWMVPATSYKLNKKTSTEKHRALQGRKGIGRYASAILGDFLRIETTDVTGQTTIIELDWTEFEHSEEDEVKYLDQINIDYENKQTNLPHGTKIEIYSKVLVSKDPKSGQIIKSINWGERDYYFLLKELRNLLSPLEKNTDDSFEIVLEYKNLDTFGFKDQKIQIEPFPLLQLYDYRIHGTFDNRGNLQAFYENQNYKESDEEIKKALKLSKEQKSCGIVRFDLMFYDLEPEAIETLINRGLKDPVTGDYLGRAETRNMLKEYAGIGIYRNLFRIRPYGDSNYDWLELNQKRINNPTLKVSTNQVVGFINIEAEEHSNLIEKSAREGLKENRSYERLVDLIGQIIQEVETRRYMFRKNAKRGRKPSNNIKDDIESLFSFDEVSFRVRTMLQKSGVDDRIIVKVEKTLKDEEKSKSDDLKKIQDTLVMYEAHAALGRLVEHVLHEGRKPLQFIGDNISYLKQDIDFFIKQPNDVEVRQDLQKFVDENTQHVKTLSTLFADMEPLTAKRLSRKKIFDIKQNILENSSFFKNQLDKNDISLEINCPDNLEFYGRKEDFFIVYSNLFENSIYWFNNESIENKKIIINAYRHENNLIIEFRDNGIGIKDKFAHEIFDAGFSTKPEGGTGIGLTLVGQAISRNAGSIECRNSDKGVFFQMTFGVGENNE